jgi:hypothetical protein
VRVAKERFYVGRAKSNLRFLSLFFLTLSLICALKDFDMAQPV